MRMRAKSKSACANYRRLVEPTNSARLATAASIELRRSVGGVDTQGIGPPGAQLSESVPLQLAHRLATGSHAPCNFVQRSLVTVTEAEPQLQHAALARVKRLQRCLHLTLHVGVDGRR